MRVCDECGTPVADSWEHCLRCGEPLEPLPPAPPNGLQRLRSRFSRQEADGALGVRSALRLRVPGVALLGGRVPAWTFAPLLVAIAALLVILAVSQDNDELMAARDAAIAEATLLGESLGRVEAERDRLTAEIAAAEERLSTLEASVASGSTNLAEAEGELAAAQTAAAEANAEVAALAEEIEASDSRIAALQECLDGTMVALAFARDGRNGAADVALEAVADACGVADG